MNRRAVGPISLAVVGFLGLLAGAARGQEPRPAPSDYISWVRGPAEGELGVAASVPVPEGYLFATGPDTGRIMALMENVVSGGEVGFLCPASFLTPDSTEDFFYLVFEFEEIGCLRNADPADLDPDAILRDLARAEQATAEERRRRGWIEREVEGWLSPPRYDAAAKTLEWSARFRNVDGAQTADHVFHILGRRGVMTITLVGDLAALPKALGPARGILAGFTWRPGFAHGDFREGDKVFDGNLADLVLGGASGPAGGTGFLARWFGVIWKALLALALLFAAFFRTIFPRKKPPTPPAR